ncbi:hypothetical protein CkaCkLH20_07455 [Colletotrichum karsti]|uniref:Cyanovirin-N domain-containing protein n=1 Tax=Colletotrichum karsti TaxID=1095194 RepID=A0A9P6LGG4_9PEZI|nr:uncharacterized protein CkaCkLH20_07455 [Colletotrichum karsti]KAF9875189.1 hypothetical protein CkaCkLH20_07455 [Colletotrichum karsti]
MNLRRAAICLLGGMPLLIAAEGGFFMNDPRDNNNEHVLAARDNAAQVEDTKGTTVIKTTLTTTTTIPSTTQTSINTPLSVSNALARTVNPAATNTQAQASPARPYNSTGGGKKNKTLLTNKLTIAADSEPAAGFIKTCITWKVWDANNHLWAKCRARGKGKWFWSRIGLDHMLGNVGGRLVYQKEGYFSSSCVSCSRHKDSRSYFQCECKDSKGEFQRTVIDLDLYLANHDGFVCSEYQCGVREDPPPGVEE